MMKPDIQDLWCGHEAENDYRGSEVPTEVEMRTGVTLGASRTTRACNEA